MPNRHALLLMFLLCLFILRVTGQILVVFFGATYLPPLQEWQSGLLPYPGLLASQIAIILLFSKICRDLALKDGYFAQPHPRLAMFLRTFGGIYLSSMIVRYVVWMWINPDARWFHGTIPIIFHCILATYLLVLAHFYKSAAPEPLEAPEPSPASPELGAPGSSPAPLLFLLLFSSIFMHALPADAAQVNWLRSAVGIHTQRNVPLETKDGIKLFADIYHPIGSKKTPTLLVRIPYTRTFEKQMLTDLSAHVWAGRGYTVVIQTTRGKGNSGGTFYPLLHEREDGIETLSWLSRQPWFNGQLMTWGGSAFGQTQWSVSDSTNPKITAFFLYECSSNFHDMFYPGGAFALQSALSWSKTSHERKDLPEWPTVTEMESAAKGFPVLQADNRAVGHDIDFFDDWATHDKVDSYWQNIDGIDRSSHIDAPVFSMAGWYDPFLPSQLADWNSIKHSTNPEVANKSRLIIGPWKHGGDVEFPDKSVKEPFRMNTVGLCLDFFDDVRNSGSHKTTSPVRIFVMGKNQWRDEQAWPLERAKPTAFYLSAASDAPHAGTLETTPATKAISIKYTYDPQNPVATAGGAMIGSGAGIYSQNSIESRPDVLTYTTEKLASDTEVTGPVKAVLYVTTSAPCTDFTAKLVDVLPDGTAYNVCDGILRSTYSPNTPTKIEVNLWPTSMVFFKGHRIRVEISSSNFPRFDANPNTGRPIASETSFIPAIQQIHHGPQTPSCIILPLVPQG